MIFSFYYWILHDNSLFNWECSYRTSSVGMDNNSGIPFETQFGDNSELRYAVTDHRSQIIAANKHFISFGHKQYVMSQTSEEEYVK